ncbi:MAG: M23 family metallopeptidase [Lachnospiraceae bacterium]|nr:M23 family metallopeptidase [Lachnospiraceae bacterium]MCI9014587.1 M23 family metallopeptidase [Lachnospiraceae bacterium]MCI9254518.1 M23 family metallopeptidase [Lachnospiraceae bacterium]
MVRRNRNSVRKERAIMLASSVLVLTALTVTGVFVKRNNNAEKEDYVVDFEAIEKSDNMTAENMMTGEELDTLFAEVGTDDLDYDPSFQEANSLHVENTEGKLSPEGIAAKDSKEDKKTDSRDKKDAKAVSEEDEQTAQTSKEVEKEIKSSEAKTEETIIEETSKKQDKSKKKEEEEADAGMFDESVDTAQKNEAPETAEAISTTVQPTLDFKEEDGLVWPIVGDVLVNYSMDKTVYFPTLQQYKYNPAIVIAANKGDSITAAADGRVVSVSYDPAIGNTVVMDLGNGYELTYGQLENITVSEGSYVSVGDGIGTVAAPTKYYSVEGTNVYFKLTKDGEPVNPMGQLN